MCSTGVQQNAVHIVHICCAIYEVIVYISICISINTRKEGSEKA